jgi:hypothetical protein
MSLPLVDSRKFIQAIRDSGYKGTVSAIAELVDNSLQAEASEVRIDILDRAVLSPDWLSL